MSKIKQEYGETVPLKENVPEKEDTPRYGYGVRHIQLVIFLLCLTVNIIGRGHMAVTVVAMTSNPKEKTNIFNLALNVRKTNDSNNIGGFMKNNITRNYLPYIIYHNRSDEKSLLTVNENGYQSGLLSSLPYVASFFTSLGFGWMSDYFTNNNILSVRNARRISNSIAQCGIAFCLILTSYTSNTAVAVTCLVIAMAAHMGVHTGWMVNHIDLAPNFSGTLMATGNTLGNIFVVLTPVVVSQVVTNTTNLIQWRIMFFIIAGVSLFCNAVFVLLVSTEVQPWNYAEQNDTCIENQTTVELKKKKDKK